MGNKHSEVSANSEPVNKAQCNSNKRIRLQKTTSDRNNSLRSFWSFNSDQSTCSVARPWSRISRKRWRESTLALPYQSCKTAWPVSQREAAFLPEFPIRNVHKDDNKFKRLPEISNGAFGKIYQISNLETDEIFALKVLSKSRIIGDNLIKQVTEEVQIQRACGHHPFIAKCPSNWQSLRNLYIVTEYIEGGELWHLLDKLAPLPIELVQLYVAQIALAIDFLHNAGVIFRDLKPENVLLDGDANVKLIDFGLSKWLPFSHTTRTVCGTPKYMAPEIMKMQPYGHAVDWWSLGVIACVMLTGKMVSLEFDPETTEAKSRLPQDVQLDAYSEDLLLRLLEVEPQKRLRSVRTLTTIAFYKGYNFDRIKDKTLKAKALLEKYYGENYREIKEKEEEEEPLFSGFDEVFIVD